MKNNSSLLAKPRISKLLNFPAPLLVAAAATFGGSSAQAADATWALNAADSWSNAASWSPAAAPGATSGTTNTDTATFGTAATSVAPTVTVDANRNIFGIDFNSNTKAYTLSGGNFLLTNGGLIQTSGAGATSTNLISTDIAIQGDGGAATFTAGSSVAGRVLSIGGGVTGVSTGNNVTSLTLNGSNTGANSIGGVIGDGAGGGKLSITKSGAGSWSLSGASTYSGGTSVTQGTLTIGAAGSLGSGAVSISSGATLSLFYPSTSSITYKNAISGAGNVSVNSSTTGTNPIAVTLINPTFSGDLTISNGATTRESNLLLANFDDQTIAGTMTSTKDANNVLRKTGPGKLTLSGTYTAGAGSFGLATNGGEMVLDYTTNNTQKLSTSNTLGLGGGKLTLKGGNYVESMAGISVDAGGATTVAQTSLGVSPNTGTTLQAGNLTRTVGGTINFDSGSIATTLTRNTNGTAGAGWATVGSVGAADWASSSAAQVSGVNWTSSGSLITLPSGSVTNGNQVSFTTSFGGLTSNKAYYVVNSSGTNFQVATTPGGAAITLTGTSGTVIATESGAITALASGSYTPWVTTGFTANANYTLTGSSVLTVGGSPNTIKISTSGSGQSLDLGSINVFLTGGLLFTGADDYAINSSTGTIAAANVTGTDYTIQQWGTGVLTINAPLANRNGSNPLTKAGPGTLVLTGTNLYKGATFINQGTVSVSSNNNLGLATTGAAVNINGGTLQATGNTAFGLYNGTAGTNDRLVTLGGGGGTIDTSGTTSLEIHGVVGETQVTTATAGAVGVVGSLTKTGTGTLILTGANTYTGHTNINGGTLNVGSTETAGTSGPLGKQTANAVGTISFGGGTLQYSAANQNDYSGRFSTAASQPISIDTNGQTVTFATALTSSGGTLAKAGAGTLTLSAVNTYSGATTVSGGTLKLGSTGSIASTSLSIANGAIFDVQAKSGGYSLSGLGLTISTDGASSKGFLEASGIALTLAGNLTVNFTNSLLANGSEDLIDFGSESGNFASVALTGSYTGSLSRSGDIWSGSNGGYNFFLDQQTGVLSFTAIPEPSTYGVGISAFLIMMAAVRRRRRTH